MKRTDAFEPLPIPSADDPIPELTEWARGMATGAHAGFAVTEAQAHFAAKPPTLYLDTTIVSYLTARLSRDAITAQRQTITRRWWSEHRARHLLYVSDVVHEEAERGDINAARARLDVLQSLPRAHVNAQTHELANRVLIACRFARREYEDAHHVAVAAFHGFEVLLTWNCTHLANPNIIPHIRRACEAYGYAPPAIYTPEQLIGVCAYGRSCS
jgi:hypothetical protein